MRVAIHSHSGGQQYAILLPDIPKWFIVDTMGMEVARDLLVKGIPREQLISGYPTAAQSEVTELCQEIEQIIAGALAMSESQNGEVEVPLTNRTTVAMISITRECNLTCEHCYVDACGALDTEMSVTDHTALAGQIRSSLCPNPDTEYRITLTGGEPFMRPDVLEIIRAYKQYGFDIGMSTNALLIGKSTAAELSRMKVTLSVSLDGASKRCHEMIRGSGTFDTTAAQIQMLVDSGIRVGVNTLIHDANFDEFEDIVRMAYDFGCSGFNPINLVQLGRACNSTLSRVSETELFTRTANLLIGQPELLPLFERTSMFSSLGAALLSGVSCESCGVGNRPCIYADSNGDIYPCANTQKPEFRLGNVRLEPLANCLRSDHEVLSCLRGLKIDTLNPRCAACDVRKFCGGDCRGETYSVTGDLHAPYVECADRRNFIIELMFVTGNNPSLFEHRANEYMYNASRGI